MLSEELVKKGITVGSFKMLCQPILFPSDQRLANFFSIKRQKVSILGLLEHSLCWN